MKKFWETPLTIADAPLNEGAKVPESFQIGNVPIAPATILAPMAGVTDTVFRRFIRNASFVHSAKEAMEAPSAVSDVSDSSENSETLNGFYTGNGTSQERNHAHHDTESQAVLKKEESSCGLLMTEFTSADGLFRTREKKRKRYLHFYRD